jgi:thiol-disulfide isomerase/thioredoxin
MAFSDLCSKLDKTYILIGTMFILILVLLFLNYQKANKIYARPAVPVVVSQETPTPTTTAIQVQQQPQPQEESKQEQKKEGFADTVNKLVLYYATWCGWSQKMLPDWAEFKASNKHGNLSVEEVACDKTDNEKCKAVQGYPTIILYKSGSEILMEKDRKGAYYPRTKEGIERFVSDNL